MHQKTVPVILPGFIAAFTLLFVAASGSGQQAAPGQPVYNDTGYAQKYSVRFDAPAAVPATGPVLLQGVASDRNGVIQVMTTVGLLRPTGGSLLFPGKLVPDPAYRPLKDRKLRQVKTIAGQFVYLDDRAVFSNAWAGRCYVKHTLPGAEVFDGGGAREPPQGLSFLVSDGKHLQYLKDSAVAWTGEAADSVKDILFDTTAQVFWILGDQTVARFSPAERRLQTRYSGGGLTCFSLSPGGDLLVGTHDGYFSVVTGRDSAGGALHRKLPATDLTVIRILNGRIWFGSTHGAFCAKTDSGYDYYASRRWLPGDDVAGISPGPGGTVLLLTGGGLTVLHSRTMTLADKASFYENQVRTRHIRNGFNATISRMTDGDPDTGILEDSDNDGLWTSMYLGGELFRYVVTRSPEALANCRESMDAMERLYSITRLPGFPARSFERSGYEAADRQVWRPAADSGWDWKSTTSSDEAIGHIFVFGAMAELIDDSALRRRAIRLIDALMQHIVDHKLYMVDWNGKPTKWGRWNPEYVNARPLMVGDRKITSSNIVAMLQTAYHFTHKKVYRDKVLELIGKYGYLDNLMRPMSTISTAPATADALSRDLSDAWNHSDDEMYFLGYWGLYRYALNDTLKEKYRTAIIDHWKAERPEKEGAWDIVTAMTGTKDFDLGAAVGYLQRYPLDLVNWNVSNSGRKDLIFMDSNFRKQTTREVLPPDELPVSRHNANRFDLDGGDDGRSEYSAGDIWLFPYWMGRYLGVIVGPETKL